MSHSVERVKLKELPIVCDESERLSEFESLDQQFLVQSSDLQTSGTREWRMGIRHRRMRHGNETGKWEWSN